MPTNYLTQFATSGTANLPTEATWQNLTERATGFQTGLARSSYFNRLFAQGANAAYVLGQFVVDYASQDANLNGATLYSNFKTALNSYVGRSFLPLSGGTMTGVIVRNGIAIQNAYDTGNVEIRGATSYTKGAFLVLYGQDHATNPGIFSIFARNANNAYSLIGDPSDGSLKWRGADIITATGGVATSGNWLYRNNSTSYLRISGGSSASTGGNVVLRGESASTNPGGVELWANTKQMTLSADGRLVWDGRDRCFGLGTYSNIHLKGVGYLTASATSLDLILPVPFGTGVSSITLTSVVGTIRVGAGGYLTPGNTTTSDVLTGSTVGPWYNLNSNCPTLRLTRSAGWGSVGVNNCVVSYDLTFAFKCE